MRNVVSPARLMKLHESSLGTESASFQGLMQLHEGATPFGCEMSSFREKWGETHLNFRHYRSYYWQPKPIHTMDENVHPQMQGQPALDPSLVNAKLDMALAPEVEMTNQLLGKGDSDSLKIHFRGCSAQPAYGAGGKAAPPPRRKLSQAGFTFLANTSTIPGKKVPHDVLASIAGQADQTCETLL